MNYSDFDKIEQDEWSLTRPTFPTPKGGTLTVVGWSGKSAGGNKLYLVKCSLCSNDADLFGDGIFRNEKLKQGCVPCGCARAYRWTEDQYKIRVRRLIGKEPISVQGKRAVMLCNKHGKYTTTLATIFDRVSDGCRKCNSKTQFVMESEEEIVKLFTSSGKFPKGTAFRRLASQQWEISCPVCRKDKFSKNLGYTFVAAQSSLLRGAIPCRCSSRYSWGEGGWVERVKSQCSEGVEFLHMDGDFTDGRTKGVFVCKEHGNFKQAVKKFKGCCPSCHFANQSKGYLNLVYDGKTCVAIKFGITSDLDSRLRGANKRNMFRMETVIAWTFPSPGACRDAENECKMELSCGILSKRELKDGWTETTHIKNLDRVIEIYENHGGKRINTNEER